MGIDRKYMWAVLCLLFGAALSMSGFLDLLSRPPFNLTGGALWYESIVHTLELGTQPFQALPGGPENAEQVPWRISIARFLIPAALIYGLLLALFQVFRRSLSTLRARFQRGHIIVCGTGASAHHLAQGLVTGEAPARVVVIDMDPEDADTEPYHRLGVPVLAGGPPVTETLLEAAGIRHAASIIAFCDDDLLNVELVLKAKTMVAASGRPQQSPLRARARVANAALRQACSLMLADRSPGFEYGLVSVERNVARRLLADFPVDGDAAAGGGPAHVLIAGFGATGRAVALEVARQAQSADERLPVVTIVDRDALAARASFLRQYPGYDRAADLRAVTLDLQDDVVESLEKVFAETPPTRVAVCFADEGLGLATAAKIERFAARCGLHDLPIFVRLAHAPAIARAIAQSSGSALARITPFGEPERIYTREIVLNESLDVLARAVHQTYLDMIGSDAPPRPSNAPWQNLAETYRDASRHTADHIEAKLRAIGCEVAPGDPAEPLAFTPEEVELLARMEHARWCAERYIAGWRHGAVRNDDTLEHPSLEPWGLLSEAERQKDRDMVIGIPRILANAGLHARRVSAPIKALTAAERDAA